MSEGLRYAAGLPSAGVRPLTEHERDGVRRRVRHATWRLAAIPIALACGVKLGVAFDSSAIGGPVVVAIGVVGLLGAASCLVAGRGAWRSLAALAAIYLLAVAGTAALAPAALLPHPLLTWIAAIVLAAVGNASLALRAIRDGGVVWHRRRVRSDLQRGDVQMFEGRLPTSLDPALRRLASHGDLVPGTGLHRLEALPTSGLIVRVDGRTPSQLQLAYVADIAPTQPHAFRAALPDGLAPAGEDTPVNLQRRSLTPAEREELSAHIHRLRRQYWPALLVTLSLAVVVGWEVTSAGSWRGLIGGTCVAWYVLAAFTWTSYIRRVRAAGKLELDRELRWVVTVDDAATRRDQHPPKLEVLPISQLAWTENATPANWRVARL